MEICSAQPHQLDEMMEFYYELIDGMADAAYTSGWVKDVYPTRQAIGAALARGEGYLGWQAGKIVAAMLVNHSCTEGYETAPWQVDALPAQVFSIHTLAVSPAMQGQGLAKQLVRFAAGLCRQQGGRAIRLDVLRGNLQAARLYESLGFVFIKTVKLFYEDTGLTEYELYELPL